MIDDILRHNYQNIVKKFVDYYRNSLPYAAMAVVDCSEIEKMAGIVKSMNRTDLASNANLNDIQRYDNMYNQRYKQAHSALKEAYEQPLLLRVLQVGDFEGGVQSITCSIDTI